MENPCFLTALMAAPHPITPTSPGCPFAPRQNNPGRYWARMIRIAGASVCLALILVYCIEWLVRPTLVVITPDSAGYMHPALILYYGVDLEAPGWARTLGYPLFLTFVLSLSGSFLQVPTVQMLFVGGTALLSVIAISVSTSADPAIVSQWRSCRQYCRYWRFSVY